ncbi:MAG: recombinase family protein [Candidatus Limiplasma sp.]|nr:recombinase family protein [Candidatus Limiplasma sp.]
MIDGSKKRKVAEWKARIHQKVYAEVNRDNYEFIPARKPMDYYDNDVSQRVGVYVRVSTEHIMQTSSYELQKKYYEDYVARHPNWTLVKIYADEGISGTSLDRRDEFNRMMNDCRAGKIDMIITKSVSRFARNVVDCVTMIRMLAELHHPVGVFFESECIFSLNEDSQMALSFLATMAQEESHIRSRSMETSLRMRLDGGLPLTPKLLGYSHDSDGNLVINPEEESTVKLIFYMYLYGYSTADIANTLTELGRRTYLGNVNWTSDSIVNVLRNERHCGYVKTRKTFTPNYLNHKSKKNRGDRPQSIYRNHHDAIITRDDYIAVQRLLDNAKYGNKSVLPELRVIDSGLLKGFVTINPRWAGFQLTDYYQAAASINLDTGGAEDGHDGYEERAREIHVQVEAGDFDMRGFEITRSEFFDTIQRPYAVFQDKKIKFSTACVRKLGKNNRLEFLVNPIDSRFAVRTAAKDSRHAIICSRVSGGVYYPKEISGAAYLGTLFQLFGWNVDFKYRVSGSLFQKDNEAVYIFNMNDAEAFIKPHMLTREGATEAEADASKPLAVSGTRIRAIPREWTNSFGNQYYLHRHIFPPMESQEKSDWKIRMEGRLFETGAKIHVTDFDELKRFISQELGHGKSEGIVDG